MISPHDVAELAKLIERYCPEAHHPEGYRALRSIVRSYPECMYYVPETFLPNLEAFALPRELRARLGELPLSYRKLTLLASRLERLERTGRAAQIKRGRF